jgi:hypothetical protein
MANQAKSKLFDIQIVKQLKANYSLYPIAFVAVFGVSLASFQIIRSLTRSPDIHVNRRSNPDPWNKLVNDDGQYVQFKYFTTMNYKKLSENNERPKIDE